MKQKICSRCNEKKDISEFSNRSDKKTIWCQDCHKIYSREHYKKNKIKYLERNNKRRLELKYWYHNLKGSLGCSRCNENDPVCLEFHHIEEKYKEISRMVIEGYSKDKILEEMKKCIILCANCHRKEHKNDYGPLAKWERGRL